MKTEGQIRHKLQQVTFRHLQRAVRTALSRRPENCVYNGAVDLPTGEVHYCKLIETREGTALPCDEAFGGIKQAGECPTFACKHTKEDVRGEFTTFLQTSDVATIALKYPDVAALLWAMDAPRPVVPHEDPDAPPPAPPPAPEPIPPPTFLYLLPDGGVATYSLQSRDTTAFTKVVVFPILSTGQEP